MKKPPRILSALVIAVLASAGLTACGSTGAPTKNEQTTIRYQSYPVTLDPFLLADAMGEFEGLTLERVGDITGGPQALQALASNQTDIGGSAFYGAIAQLVATGAPIKAVIPFYGSNEQTNSKLVVLESSGIHSARDLIGKTIAVNTLGANSEAVLDTWFAQQGLTPAEQDQITLVPLPPLNTPEALSKGQVDAAVLSFLAYQHTATRYPIRELVNDVEVIGGPYAGGAITLRTSFIEQNPNTSRQLVAGVAKAIEFIETHDKQEVFDLYFPYLEKHGFTDYIEPIRANYPGTLGLAPKATISDEDIQRWVDWLGQRGDIDARALDVSRVYTNDLNPNA
ncbi:MAG: ABC transporter substrate-binding protein [Propioniciclava sp.]|uniref:ABC transporter substrate-binding protein n=1 Tax=Propioniciclava sp. TaxID=2038686 RepID=UPI0039E3AAD2